jgi:predicted amidophosphoribosyltransferase
MTDDPRNCPLCGRELKRDPIAQVLICPECQLDFESAVTLKAKREHEEQGTERSTGSSQEEPVTRS